MKHPDHVEGFDGSLDELAKLMGNMRYDSAVKFLGKLADDYKEQAEKDEARGRVQLAEGLHDIAGILYGARVKMQEIWKICEPHMKE